MKKEYSKPIVDIEIICTHSNITALIVSENALNWVNGTNGAADSVDWE